MKLHMIEFNVYIFITIISSYNYPAALWFRIFKFSLWQIWTILWCWRRVLRVSWMERKTNISIIENIKPEWTLESRVAKAALSYFGHVVRAGGMEDDVMLGRMNGARKRGRTRQRWVDTLKGYASGATISDMKRDARERAGWRGATTAVARGRMRLDGTRWQGEIWTNIIIIFLIQWNAHAKLWKLHPVSCVPSLQCMSHLSRSLH